MGRSQIKMHAALLLLVAAAGLTDGLQVRPALRQQHALSQAYPAPRSSGGGSVSAVAGSSPCLERSDVIATLVSFFDV